MNYKINFFVIFSLFAILVSESTYIKEPKKQDVILAETQHNLMIVYIIVGSIRSTHTGLKIAQNIKKILDERPEIKTEIVDIASYDLPLYTDELAPAQRKNTISDPLLKKWSDTIQKADGFIIVSPEYNAGYPASLKNALDSLYQEWNHKPVAFVGYSGGNSGGASMIAQLRQVACRLQMVPVNTDVQIPCSWKIFDDKGDFLDQDNIKQGLHIIIDQLLNENIHRKP